MEIFLIKSIKVIGDDVLFHLQGTKDFIVWCHCKDYTYVDGYDSDVIAVVKDITPVYNTINNELIGFGVKY